MPTELAADCERKSNVEATRMTAIEIVHFCDANIGEFAARANGRRVDRVRRRFSRNWRSTLSFQIEAEDISGGMGS